MSARRDRALTNDSFGPIALGAAPLGNLYARVGDEDAIGVVRRAYRAGVRYFDTAPHYGNGLSEHRVGSALRDVARGDYLLSSKVGRLLIADDGAPRDQNGYVGVLPFVQRYDYTGDGTRRSIEDSLQRLGVSRLDIVYIHDIDRDTHGEAFAPRFRDAMEGAVPALARLKRDGAIGGYGLGVNDWRVCMDALAHADLDFILLAGRYTLLDQSALPELLPESERRGVKIVLGGPYNSGILATGAHPPRGAPAYFNYAPASAAIVAKVERIEAVCAAHAVPLRAAALQFPRAHPAVATVLVGARSAAEIDENVALANAPIPADFWRALKSEGLLPDGAPLPGGSRA
jgi:D-threo-aldose 1-dehydrogenase